MAPPPEYDKEPKAPDKNVTTTSSDDSKVLYNIVKDQQANPDHKGSATTTSADAENNKHVETLDDGQLRALLDEAITYKCPKDREGKSSLFKELLHEVEQDEQACEAARGLSAGRGARRGGRARPDLQSNSLQDLVAAMAEPAPRRPRAPPHHPPAQVSARAHHGGSLPSGVDTSSLLSEEPTRGGYLATVRCVNPPPLAERRVSASDANGPDLDLIARRSKPTFPMTYTARATLEIGSGSVCTGRAVTTTTASNQVDSAIPFTCITTPEVVASCNTTSSTPQSAVAIDPKPLQLSSCYRAVASLTGAWSPVAPAPAAAPPAPAPAAAPPAPAPDLALDDAQRQQPRSVISSSFNGLPLSRPNYGSTASSATDEYKVPILTVHYRLQKSLDENGNAVQGFSSPISGSSQHKKPRRKKSTKNETVIKSHQIDGYQGNKDLNEVLRFIESNADTARGHKLGRAKHKDDSDDKGGKKRSTERRKDKENKMKRASSLEELSRTKLEDLTDEPEPRAQPWTEPPPAKPERRSWGDDARETFYYREPDAPDAAAAGAELTDFQTVTKKRKPRRRADDAAADPPRRARPPSPRRAPSDRSNDSNDDLDSVHSLPADAPADAPAARAPPAPHASYADIARTRHNIPDLIESCNFYAEGEADGRRAEPAGAAPADGEYPALAARRARDKPAAPAARAAARKERAEPPAPDVVADRRPPVVLLDSAARPRDMDGVTFGFDVNEQLLGAPARRARCDLVRDAAEAAPAGGVAVRAGCAALRYVPPRAPPPHAHQLHQIVDYVGAAWEDVVRCGGGKVRYFSE